MLALHRLTSRGRLFSRETSLSNADEPEILQQHNARILRTQNTTSSSNSGIAASVVGTMICVPDSGPFCRFLAFHHTFHLYQLCVV